MNYGCNLSTRLLLLFYSKSFLQWQTHSKRLLSLVRWVCYFILFRSPLTSYHLSSRSLYYFATIPSNPNTWAFCYTFSSNFLICSFLLTFPFCYLPFFCSYLIFSWNIFLKRFQFTFNIRNITLIDPHIYNKSMVVYHLIGGQLWVLIYKWVMILPKDFQVHT